MTSIIVVDKMTTPNVCVAMETVIRIILMTIMIGTVTIPMATTMTIITTIILLTTMSTIIIITMVTTVSVVQIAVMEMAMVLLPLFNRTMNVVSMVDTCGDTAISTRAGTTQPQFMATVAGIVMTLTDQQATIILLSMAVTILPTQNCNGLPFMADPPVWMMVCWERNVQNPTRLANLFSVDYTQTMPCSFHSNDHIAPVQLLFFSFFSSFYHFIPFSRSNPGRWSHVFSVNFCFFHYFVELSFKIQYLWTFLCQHRLYLWYMLCQVLPLLLELRFVLPEWLLDFLVCLQVFFVDRINVDYPHHCYAQLSTTTS
jgi:hypothetical protein